MPDRHDQATSFDAGASAYERGRPSYPEAAVRWCLPDPVGRVLDLGAGTGKLTQVLARLDLDVVAVEPLPGMREQFRRTLPGLDVREGTGEHIPLPDASVDVVFCAQAWHWVDPDLASPEVARVLRPGGRLALLWNVREPGTGWSRALDDLLEASDGTQAMDDPVRVAAPFGMAERRDFPWRQPLTPDTLLDLVTSRSYYLTMPPAEQEQFRRRLRRTVLDRDDVRGRSTIEQPYRTECWLYHRP